MRTPTKWTSKVSVTFLMGPTGLPDKVLLKQKFKINLSSWVSYSWLALREKSMRTPNKWTPKGFGTLLMGPTGLPEKVLQKQKFKITLSSWVSNAWLSIREQFMRTHEDTY